MSDIKQSVQIVEENAVTSLEAVLNMVIETQNDLSVVLDKYSTDKLGTQEAKIVLEYIDKSGQ